VSKLLDRACERLGGVADANALQRIRAAWLARDACPGDVDIDEVLLVATLVAWMDRYDLQPG
jgi:hypothetical protein